jgi:hypothetical protein
MNYNGQTSGANNAERPHTRTRSYATTNAYGIVASAFEWGFRDDMLTVSISPELPESEQSEKRRYDYEHNWYTMVSRLKCFELYNKAQELLIPALEKKEPVFISVTIADVNQFGIGVRIDESGDTHGYAKIIRNINPDTLTTDAVIEYEFRKNEVVMNYDTNTGSFNKEMNDTELLLFINDLKAFVDASSNAYIHSDRVVSRYATDTMNTMVKGIANKVGFEMPNSFTASRSGATYGTASIFTIDTSKVETKTISSLDDINMG